MSGEGPRPLLVLEDTSPPARRTLFRVGSVTWAATGWAWVSPFFWCGLGVVVSMAERGAPTRGLAYGALLYGVNVIHSLGHVVAGRLLGAPMATVLLTSTRDVTVYREPGASLPPLRRATRACGGPALNLLVGTALLVAWTWLGLRWLLMWGAFNVAVAAWTLMPVPTMDGWVIWRAAWESMRRDTASPTDAQR